MPEFKVANNLKVEKSIIDSPFETLSAIGPAQRIIGKLQPYLLKDENSTMELGLIAVNTPDRTCIGRMELEQNNTDEKPKLLKFVLRKVLNRKYTTAMCHGSRLICD